MKRRNFLRNSLGLTAGALLSTKMAKGLSFLAQEEQPFYASLSGKFSRYSHRLPKTDQNYKRSKNYIEDDPIPEYSWASDEAYEAFQDMKYGVRIHWGLYSILEMGGESWPFLGNREPAFDFQKRQEYQELYKTWNPKGFDANEWMEFFKESGMKMFAFTTKHHEGFSMYDTKTRVKRRPNWTAPGGPKIEECDTTYSIMDTPFKRDVVKELCDAAREHDIKIDLYYSHSDWYDADFRPYGYHPLQIPASEEWCKAKADDEEFTEFERSKQRQKAFLTIVPNPTPEEEAAMIARHRAQLTELLSNYGKVDMVCLDIWLGPRVWPQLRKTLLELRKIQPNVMFRARGIGNYGDYYTPEGFVPGNKENSDSPWFVIYPLAGSFSYDPSSKKYKGAKWVVKNLIDSASKGGNFMVGIGPDGNGKFSPTAIKQLKEVGAWLKKNGEGIYATRAREGEQWKEGDNIRFTRSKDQKTIYVHCLDWPGDQLVLKTVQPKAGSKITCLGNQKTVNWDYNNSTKELTIYTSAKVKAGIPKKEQIAYSFAVQV
ncbi:alpha-L-fucosidase [Pedobacter aquae]|nr:alpha-L-fucosidase [Pedobacter aquae]